MLERRNVHLQKKKVAGPWASIFCIWDAALTRRESFLQAGATEIYILAVDLELFNHTSFQNLGRIVDAYSIVSANDLPNIQYYGYNVGPRVGFPMEYLIARYIRKEAVVAYILGLDPFQDIPIHLGVLRIPQAMVEEAGRGDEQAIKSWTITEVFCNTSIRDWTLVQRLLRAMCIAAWN